METPARLDPALVVARGGTVGALALVLGVAGHVSADGLLPGPAVLVLLAAVSVVGGVVGLARPAGAVRMTVLLVGGQTLVHLALTITAGHRGDAPLAVEAPAATGGPRLPSVDGRRLGSLQDAYAHLHPAAGPVRPSLPLAHLMADLSAHAPMMAAHLVVAGLLALWLARGERALLTLLTLAGARLGRLLLPLAGLASVPALRPGRPRPSALLLLRPPTPQAWGRSVVRRGPPLTA